MTKATKENVARMANLSLPGRPFPLVPPKEPPVRGRSDDPFARLSRRRRWALHRTLRRAWRQGLADRHAVTLHALRGSLGTDPVVAVTTAPAGSADGLRGRPGTAEIAFTSGLRVRLGLCHPPAVTALGRRSHQQATVLEHAAYHGFCWGLYFVAGDDHVPVLADEISVVTDPGGGLVAPPPPAWAPA